MPTLLVKNMVCDRCKKVLKDELEAIGIKINTMTLGKIDVENNPIDMNQVKEVITKNGFELIENEDTLTVETIKLFLIALIDDLPIQRDKKLSVLLAGRLNKDYSTLSKLFSRSEGITLEKFFLKLKLEKVKELIQGRKYSFSEIAHFLDYANSNHLAMQFKSATGMSMTDYRKSANWERKPLDKII